MMRLKFVAEKSGRKRTTPEACKVASAMAKIFTFASHLSQLPPLRSSQKPMPIVYDNIRFDEAFRSDLVVNGKVIVELKSVEALLSVHAKQLLTQLRLSGLLISFGEAHLKNGIKRVINGLLEAENPVEVSL